MCSNTGKGAPKKRALPGVSGPPLTSWVNRTMPATTGMNASAIGPAGLTNLFGWSWSCDQNQKCTPKITPLALTLVDRWP